MALPKRVRDTGGSFYKGHKLTVSAAAADYVLDMIVTATGCAINGITVIPDTYGAGDYFKLEHLDSSGTAVEKNDGVLAETIYNVGKSAAIHFDFVSLELFEKAHKLRLTYTNVAGVSMSVYAIVERVK